MKHFTFLILLLLTAFSVFGSPPGISIGNKTVVEGNSGQRIVEVSVILSQVVNAPVSLSYRSRNGSAMAGADYVAVNGTVSFAQGERLKKINIPVNGDLVVEGTESFEIILGNSANATMLDSIAVVSIINDDLAGPGPAVYEVRLTYTGYALFYGKISDCPIRSNGTVILTGLLSGKEDIDPTDDVEYKGVLDLQIDLDVCSLKPVAAGDEHRFCGMTVLFTGPVETDLKIYFDSRGAYIQCENTTGNYSKLVYGGCDAAEQSEEETKNVPNNTIASVFNGRDLPMLTNRTLQVGQLVENDDGHITVVDVLRKIR
ncbi:MAG: Calx-beta domain-containing protein [Bacteroidota bacterium]